VIGTSVGTQVFVRHGWRADAALGLGFYGFLFVILLLRGPHCQRFTWIGYEGGLDARKSVGEATKMAVERDMVELPASSHADSGKDLESAVVSDSSEHKDEQTESHSDPMDGKEGLGN
jgi:hypothetical protein